MPPAARIPVLLSALLIRGTGSLFGQRADAPTRLGEIVVSADRPVSEQTDRKSVV